MDNTEQLPEEEDRRWGYGSTKASVGDISSGITIGSGVHIYTSELADAQPGDVQKIAAEQINILGSYYNAVLGQAKMSFRWALVAAGIGLSFFIGAILFLLVTQSQAVATISAISGALVEVIAGINFYYTTQDYRPTVHLPPTLGPNTTVPTS